jgi:hypothetical protein
MFGVRVSAGPEAEDEEVAEATSQLRRELLELDIGSVERARAGDPPSGTKAIELVALGTLLVNVAAAYRQVGLLDPGLALSRRPPQPTPSLRLEGMIARWEMWQTSLRSSARMGS